MTSDLWGHCLKVKYYCIYFEPEENADRERYSLNDYPGIKSIELYLIWCGIHLQ